MRRLDFLELSLRYSEGSGEPRDEPPTRIHDLEVVDAIKDNQVLTTNGPFMNLSVLSGMVLVMWRIPTGLVKPSIIHPPMLGGM